MGTGEECMNEIHPVGNRVLIRVEEVQKQTAGGIYLPDESKDRLERMKDVGEVVEFGPLAFVEDGGPKRWGTQVGDLVLFGREGGKIVVDELDVGKGLRIINDSDLQAVIVKKD
jgi:chaperonin GroES